MAWNLFGGKKKNELAETSESDSSNPEDGESDSPAGDGGSSDASPADPTAEKKGFFGRFKQALVKTYSVLNTDVRDLLKNEGRLVDDDFLKELFAILIKTDMGAGPASKIRDEIKSQFRGRKVYMADFIATAKTTIREIMDQPERPIEYAESGPTIVMVCGVNGAGKTTSIAKLTNMFIKDGKKVVLGAGDTFRAAAVEQLNVWANRLGAEIVMGSQGGDPASVSYRAVEAAVKSNADICIVDTAGRLQTQTNLMDQLSKIRNVMQKVVPEAPHEVLLVLDATAGQNAISQAKGFSAAAGCTGIVLAKLDGTAKGGVAIPIRQEFDLPVKYIGLGEKEDDIALFNVDTYVDALFPESFGQE
ncbi:signal recognition particle-docking protein FtsY [Pirellulaceae bacterium]|jgi:fused signal recognition particle receptor|nr:signal recognition particle-docking protein FtsY [Pirellulaceae bacterium]